MNQGSKYLLIATVLVGTCASMTNLRQWQFAETELYKRTLSQVENASVRCLPILEKALGPNHRGVAWSLENLADLYYAQGKYTEAEPLYKRTLAMDEKTLDANHPDLAIDLNNLANLYYMQGKYTDAEPLYKRVLAIDEKTLDANHPDLAIDLNNLANLYYMQEKYTEAEPFYKRALAIDEKTLDANHPDLLSNNLPLLHQSAQRIYLEAEKSYSELLRKTDRKAEADKLSARAKAILDAQNKKVGISLIVATSAAVNSAWAADYPKEYEATYEIIVEGDVQHHYMHYMSDGKGHMRTEASDQKGITQICLKDYLQHTWIITMDINGPKYMKRFTTSSLPDYVGDDDFKNYGAFKKDAKDLGTKVIDKYPCHGYEKTFRNGKGSDRVDCWYADDTKHMILQESVGFEPKCILKLKSWVNTAPSFSMSLPSDYKPYPQPAE